MQSYHLRILSVGLQCPQISVEPNSIGNNRPNSTCGWRPLEGLTDCMGGSPGQPVRTVRDLEDEPGGRIVIRMSRITMLR